MPSHALGHTLGERLALEGANWANLRFARPLDIALQMAAPFLLEREIDPAPESLGPALIMRLLLELPGNTPPYFRPLAEQPKMADALWATLRELRLAGVRAANLPRPAFASAAKHAELQALLAAYENHLAVHRLADSATVYLEALHHPDLCPVRPEDAWVEPPGAIWSSLERKLLDALPGHRLVPATVSLRGLMPARRLAILAAPPAAVEPNPTSDAERLAFLLSPADAPSPTHDGTLAMFRAGGKDAEVEEVFRRILANRLPLDQVEIACASPDYIVLFWEKAQAHTWPLTVGPGIPIVLTRPARALLTFASWIAAGFPAGGLRRLLQSGDLRLEIDGGPTAGQAARLLAKSNATWGRETYAAALAGLAEAYRQRADDPEADARAAYLTRSAQAQRIAEWIANLISLVPEPPPDTRVGLGSLLAACAIFVNEYGATGSALDGAAAAAVGDALDELQSLGDLARPLPDLLGLIRDRIEGLNVGGDRARPGHLYVTTLTHAGQAGRPCTFVVALEEGGVFPTLLEDPVLLDEERQKLSPFLPTSRDRVSEALAVIVSQLARLSGHVCLSFSCRDLRENRETFPSWLLLQVLRLQEPRPDRELTYDDLNAYLGEPVSLVPAHPDHALSDAGWWLAQLRGAGTQGRAPVLTMFPRLAQGEFAEATRASEAFTVYDGLVPPAGSRLDPRRSGQAVSATSLENLATCPFRYFLERGLHIEPLEEAEPDPDAWLDHLTRGAVLHSLYARFLRELRTAKERPDPVRHDRRLRALGEETVAELRVLIPPPSEGVYAREADEFLRDLAFFLRLEAEATDRTPQGLEISFGSGESQDEALAQADPVTVDLGPGLRFLLRGRMDRLDRLSDGTYEVVDYKTGRFWRKDWDGTFAGGRTLQHALYAIAATELLRKTDPKARVTLSSYYFPTRRGRGERVPRPQGDSTTLATVLRDLFDLLAAGTFIHAPNEEDCRYCNFHRACGSGSVTRAKQKLDYAANTALGAYRRLIEHA